MDAWVKVVVLSVGGTLGVNARYWLGVAINRWASPQFPWATFTINVSGSFLIGFLTLTLTRWLPHPNLRLFVITGFLGGYTTFSTFEFESATLLERGEPWLLMANLVASVVAGFVAVLLGMTLARGIVASRPPDRPTEQGFAIAQEHAPPEPARNSPTKPVPVGFTGSGLAHTRGSGRHGSTR